MILLYKALKTNLIENIIFNKQFLYISIDIKYIFNILKDI